MLNPELSLLNNLVFNPNLYASCQQYFERISAADFEDKAAAAAYTMIQDAFAKDEKQTQQSLFNMLTAEATPDNVRQVIGYVIQHSQCRGLISEIDIATQSISDSAKRRALAASAMSILTSIKDPSAKDVTSIIQDAQRDITALASKMHDDNNRNRPQDVVELSMEFLKDIESNLGKGRQCGLMTGFESLDAVTTGLKPGSLNIIAARPGVGKTAFALNIIEHVAAANTAAKIRKPVVFFSLEMPKHQIIKRMFSTFGRVAPQHLEDGLLTKAQWDDILRNIKAMCINTGAQSGVYNLYIDDNVSLTASGIVATVKEIAKQYDGISMIAVDYVQLLKPEYRGQNRNSELAETSRTLKLLAMEYNCPVLALSQLNRDIDRRTNHKPVNSDLRDSGALEADADTIMFLSKESQYAEGQPIISPTGTEQILLSVSKNRHGGIGEMAMSFTGMYSLFEDNKTQLEQRMAQRAYERDPANFRKQKKAPSKTY